MGYVCSVSTKQLSTSSAMENFTFPYFMTFYFFLHWEIGFFKKWLGCRNQEDLESWVFTFSPFFPEKMTTKDFILLAFQQPLWRLWENWLGEKIVLAFWSLSAFTRPFLSSTLVLSLASYDFAESCCSVPFRRPLSLTWKVDGAKWMSILNGSEAHGNPEICSLFRFEGHASGLWGMILPANLDDIQSCLTFPYDRNFVLLPFRLFLYSIKSPLHFKCLTQPSQVKKNGVSATRRSRHWKPVKIGCFVVLRVHNNPPTSAVVLSFISSNSFHCSLCSRVESCEMPSGGSLRFFFEMFLLVIPRGSSPGPSRSTTHAILILPLRSYPWMPNHWKSQSTQLEMSTEPLSVEVPPTNAMNSDHILLRKVISYIISNPICSWFVQELLLTR